MIEPPSFLFTPPPHVSPKLSRGPLSASALLLVLTAIALLSLVIIGVVQTTQFHIENHLLFAKRDHARRLAESGISFALHPKILPDDPLLDQKINAVESFQVTLASEGGRINLNALLSQNERPLLLHLFTTWDLTLEEAEALCDTLADWVDSDNLKHLNGAETEDYIALDRTVKPTNRPFQSIEEIAQVIGMEILEKKHPQWRESFTLWSEGPLDLNEASAELISLVTEVGLPQAESLVHYRTQADPQDPNKIKKQKIATMEQAAQLLGLSNEQLAKIAPRITVQSQTFRIKSVGKIDQFKHTIETVLRRNTQPPTFLLWNES